MQIGQPASAAQTSGASANANTQVASLRIFVFALFFTFGGITSLNDVIIPKLKDLFTLSYAQAMLVQSAFFAAYFIVSLPAAAIVQRIGYMRTAVVGLLTMTAELACCSSPRPRPACSSPSCWRCSCWRPASPSCRSWRIR
ncbi:hypothetical protein [Massilia phosphatilytica]